MKRITTLTGKNIPRLSVARGGEPISFSKYGDYAHLSVGWCATLDTESIEAFGRVFDDMGLKLRDEK